MDSLIPVDFPEKEPIYKPIAIQDCGGDHAQLMRRNKRLLAVHTANCEQWTIRRDAHNRKEQRRIKRVRGELRQEEVRASMRDERIERNLREKVPEPKLIAPVWATTLAIELAGSSPVPSFVAGMAGLAEDIAKLQAAKRALEEELAKLRVLVEDDDLSDDEVIALFDAMVVVMEILTRSGFAVPV